MRTKSQHQNRGRWDTSQGKKKELRIQINGEVGKIYDSR